MPPSVDPDRRPLHPLLLPLPSPRRCPPQAMVFGVAMNSQKNTLVALLIAANFTEIKGGRV